MSLVESVPPTLRTTSTALLPISTLATPQTKPQPNPITNPLSFIKLYESKLKLIYTLNLTLLDKLAHTSLSLLLIDSNHKLVQFYQCNFKDLKQMLFIHVNSSMTHNSFNSFLISQFNDAFEELLQELAGTYLSLFKVGFYYKLEGFNEVYRELLNLMGVTSFGSLLSNTSATTSPTVYSSSSSSSQSQQSHSHSNVSLNFDSTSSPSLKTTKATSETIQETINKINELEFKILCNSESLQLYKKLNGQYDPECITNHNLKMFKRAMNQSHTGLALLITDDGDNDEELDDEKREKKHEREDLEIVKSVEFQQFNLKRLADLGLFRKTIF
ncbi:unnamed protein product [Ambrosiozyma monospora]|uniref:Unnamed protein product n=1 Tax=Ambrosiozyma monospora TaxID=43982 RepID=A0A9W6YUP2_AMBMO|nr:unnamed protein product [Ambrosiozyma monospora]